MGNIDKETPEQVLSRVKDEVAREWKHEGVKLYQHFDHFLYCSHENRPEMNEAIKQIAFRFHEEMQKQKPEPVTTTVPSAEEYLNDKYNLIIDSDSDYIASMMQSYASLCIEEERKKWEADKEKMLNKLELISQICDPNNVVTPNKI